MSEQEIKNAKVTSTMLGVEDHGILSFWIYLDFGGSGQGFGGWALDGKPAVRFSGERQPSATCGAIIAAILKAVGVDTWEALPGQIVRVRGTHSQITAIGHALKDQWCEPAEVFRKLEAANVG